MEGGGIPFLDDFLVYQLCYKEDSGMCSVCEMILLMKCELVVQLNT